MTNVSCITALAAAAFVSAGISSGTKKGAYRVLGNDRQVAIVNARGEVEWNTRPAFDGHDLWLLANRQRCCWHWFPRVAEVS